MCEIVDGYYILVFHSELPHISVFGEFILILDVYLVLLHGLAVGVVSFPDFAVAVVEDGVVFGLGQEGSGV